MDEHTTPPNPPDAAGSNAADDDVVTLRALTLALVHQYRGPQADAEPHDGASTRIGKRFDFESWPLLAQLEHLDSRNAIRDL